VTGAGYDDEAVKKMQDAVKKSGVRQVVWLSPNLERTDRPPLGLGYAAFVVSCVKECLGQLKTNGVLGRKGDGSIYFY
jgi:hypothetical protein